MKDYKETFSGSTFPDAAYSHDVPIKLSSSIILEYIPMIEKFNLKKGTKLLLIIMTQKEGFFPGSKSYRTNNPGNIGNTDSGATSGYKTLQEGIAAQLGYFDRVVSGKHPAYPLGKRKLIKPFFSAEIDKNKANYGMSGHIPGYDFLYTGQLDQFVKIYSTGARAGNSYINIIMSFFRNHGIEITPETTLQEIAGIE